MTDLSSDVEQQIHEYESQLADVEELLKVSPSDDALQSLKSDLTELLKITRQSLQGTAANSATAADAESLQNILSKNTAATAASDLFEKALEAAVGTSIGFENDYQSRAGKRFHDEVSGTSFVNVVTEAAEAASASTGVATSATEPNGQSFSSGMEQEKIKKPKTTSIKEFEIPTHLLPNDTDSEAERNKKRRAIKALKSKWREKKKEIESEKKQQSWQSFQKKTKTLDKRSMFSTQETETSTKVGVVTVSGGRQMTDFGERKRHK